MAGQVLPKLFDLRREEFLETAAKAIVATDVVADIGCGIVPMSYFRPKLHFMIEPWKEYSDILAYRHRNDRSVVILRTGALEALRSMTDKSVDSIFMLDVIEHLEKEMGVSVIAECERVARQQIVIFTPLGFMPQHMEDGQRDGWGLSGATVQEHLSGWTPEDDFGPDWLFYVCKDFHQIDFKADSLAEAFGAFFAIRNFDHTPAETAKPVPDIQERLPSEKEVEYLKAVISSTRENAQNLEAAYEGLKASRSVRIAKAIRKLLGK